MPSTKAMLITGAVALAAIILVAYVQRNVMPIPVLGAYLPR